MTSTGGNDPLHGATLQHIVECLADYYGWEEFAPFDKVIVTCGIDHVPPPLLQQQRS